MPPKPPLAKLIVPTEAMVGLTVVVDPTGSKAARGSSLTSGTIGWGDGDTTSWVGPPSLESHIYQHAGTFTIVLTIWDSKGMSGSRTASLTVMPATPLPTEPPPPSLPAVPSGVVALAGDGQVAVQWTTVPDATAYAVKRSQVSGGPYSLIGSPSTNSFTDTSVTNGITYFYVVSALNSAGESANSAQVSATPQASAPPPPPPPPPSGNVIYVLAGMDLQVALDAAIFGDTIVIEAGATFTVSAYQSFILRYKGAGSNTTADTITIQSSDLVSLPPAGSRVSAALHAGMMPKIRGSGGAPVFKAEPFAHHYTVIGLDISTDGNQNLYTADLVDVAGQGSAPGGSSTAAERLGTHHITYDRCFLHPAEVPGGAVLRSPVDYRTSGRGMQLCGSHNSIINSDLRGFGGYYAGTTTVIDAYGVYMPVASANLLIENNYIEAHTMNVFSGGGFSLSDNHATITSAGLTQATFSQVANLAINDLVALRVSPYPHPVYGYLVSYQVVQVTGINGLVVSYQAYGVTGLDRVPLSPGDAVWNGYNIDTLTVRGNTIAKIEQAGGKKGYLELKAGLDVLVEGNDFIGEWASDVSLTPRNQDGAQPWMQTSNVIFRNNRGYFSRFFTVLGHDNEQSSTPSHDILIANNLGLMAANPPDTVDHSIFAGGGRTVTYRHNTIIEPSHGNSTIFTTQAFDGDTFTFEDNICFHMNYGWNCQVAPNTFATCYGSPTNRKNVIINNSAEYSNAQIAAFPWGGPNNFVVSTIDDVGFVDVAAENYRLAAASPFKNAASDGTDIGCDIDALEAAL